MDNDPKFEKQARLIARNMEGEAMRWRMTTPGVLTVLLTDGRKVNQLLPEPKLQPKPEPKADEPRLQPEADKPRQESRDERKAREKAERDSKNDQDKFTPPA